MNYRRAVLAFIALMMPCAAFADTLPEHGENIGRDQVESDLTGYWQQDDGQIFRFSQAGSNLISRRSEPVAGNVQNQIDFTATIYGNLIYGAYRAPSSRALPGKCSNQIWVGMGLTLNEERTKLTGFRGERIVDRKTCSIKDSAPVGLVYTRIGDPEPGE